MTELHNRGLEIVAVTRNRERLSGILPDSQIIVIDLDTPPEDVFERLGRPDLLLHLAWDGLPNYRSLHHFERELPSQYRFLKQLIVAGLPSLVVTGTCFEYGMQPGQLAEDGYVSPANPYGFAKDSLRRQLEFLLSEHPFKMTWARLFYVFGEGQPQTSLYSQLTAAVARGDKSFAMSGGEQLRDYLPITEVARLIVELGLRQANLGIVNICSGQPISVKQLVEGWVERHNWDIQLDLGRYPYPDYEPMAFWGDRRKLDEFLSRAGVTDVSPIGGVQ
jgi:nucleoside-diphosphate-sugar epimerase